MSNLKEQDRRVELLTKQIISADEWSKSVGLGGIMISLLDKIKEKYCVSCLDPKPHYGICRCNSSWDE